MRSSHLVGAVAAFLGIATHHFYFIRGEHHIQALLFLKLLFLLPSLSTATLIQLWGLSLANATALTAWITAVYICSLWTSMFIYRGLFHRLRHFPGPPLAKFTKFYHSLCCYRFDNHRVRTRWHEKYGDIVRTGKR